MVEAEFLRRTRESYDRLAAPYTEWIQGELAARPTDRAALAVFAELVRDSGGGPVLDVGCGPGRMTAHLAGLGLDVSGVDLAPGMVAAARRSHPGRRFTVGSMLDLDVADGALAGILAWYSVIHVPGERLPEVFAEFHRALAPGGYLQLAFQVGEDVLHLADAAGHPVDLDFHRLQPERVAELLADAGLTCLIRTVREPDADGRFPERTPQGYLLARKPVRRRR